MITIVRNAEEGRRLACRNILWDWFRIEMRVTVCVCVCDYKSWE